MQTTLACHRRSAAVSANPKRISEVSGYCFSLSLSLYYTDRTTSDVPYNTGENMARLVSTPFPLLAADVWSNVPASRLSPKIWAHS
jgi:hypothetical protein